MKIFAQKYPKNVSKNRGSERYTEVLKENGSVIAFLCEPSFEYLSAGNEGDGRPSPRPSVTESNNSKGCKVCMQDKELFC